jgi:hypothetical protein
VPGVDEIPAPVKVIAGHEMVAPFDQLGGEEKKTNA